MSEIPSSAATTLAANTSPTSIELSEKEITQFASQFDPQPYHLDAAAGAASIFGGLCASGWQIAALGTRLAGDALEAQGMAFVSLSSVDDMRWRRPSFANEALRARVTVERVEPGSNVPHCDTAHLKVDIVTEALEVLAVMTCAAAIDDGKQRS